MGKERLTGLSQQLGNMFGQAAAGLAVSTRGAAAQPSIKSFIHSGGADGDSMARAVLQKLKLDSTWVSIELLNTACEPVLQVGHLNPEKDINRKAVISSLGLHDDHCKIGKLFAIRDSIYYPIVAAVVDKDERIGYVVRWRLQLNTRATILQFSQLIGTNAILYVGNSDRTLWTDLIKPVAAPRADTGSLAGCFEFSPAEATGSVIASATPIPNTPWLILIGFPKKSILEASSNFLYSTIIIGTILTLAGILIAWLMSRNITGPLNKLTAAASAMAEGDDSAPVQENRGDELGKLAHAFAAMKNRVDAAHADLEQKVNDRTTQLQTVNGELEAFSYSVSHDLRAPLRAISGFATMLKEDYGDTLDSEGHRLIEKIVSNVNIMKQLIDSLILFSKMGAAVPVLKTIDMTQLAQSCMEELLQQEPRNKYRVQIHRLPACQGDQNLIKQVWMNFISNAIKYSSKQEHPSIEIGCVAGTGMSTYFIRDNGAGFDMQYADKLFGVFQRLHSHKDFEGSGIGLAFVKRIIVKHKGEVRAESTQGKGATFYFSLPGPKPTPDLSGIGLPAKHNSMSN